MSQSPEARTPEPLTAEQIVTMLRPDDAQISPDGSHIAYVVAPASKDVSKDVEHGISTIWIVDVDGGEPRQFTGGQWEDDNPRWSPDGNRIAFLSDRAERGEKSVYVMPVDGGEAVRVFDQQGSMRNLQWSPDGTKLSILYRDPESDEEKQKKENKEDVKVWDEDRKWQRLWLIDLESGEAKAVSPDKRQVWGYAWSPDGSKLVLNTSPNPRLNDLYFDTWLTVVSSDGSESTDIRTLRGSAADLVWSADGERLAFRSSEGRTLAHEHVFTIPATGGEVVNITPELDGTAEGLIKIGDGGQLGLHIAHHVSAKLKILTWDGELREAVDPCGRGSFPATPSFSADGSRVAIVWEDAAHAPDVYVQRSAEGGLERRTHLNPDVEQAALGEVEIVRWESDPGMEIEGLLLKPAGYQEGERYPLIVEIHGGPTWYWADQFFATWHEWGHYLAGRGFAVLYPNPRGSTGRGSEFVNALFNEVGRGEYRDIMAGVDAMIERGIADPDRLGIGGWSWGGYLTAWAVTQTNRFKAGVMGAGLPNMITDNSIGDIPGANLSYFPASPYEDPDPYYEHSAIRYISRCETPLLILHGEADDRVNLYQGVEMYVALRELGKEHQFVTYPREGHAIKERKHQRDLIQRVGNWYAKYL